MKIICLVASPRPEGNSATIAKQFCDTAKKNGAQVQTYYLNKMNYKGCQGCMACKTKLEKCVLKDDLTEVLDGIHDTDVVVLATPIYWYEISSQLKAFIDRTYSYLVSDYSTNPKPSRLPAGKKMVFIQVQGHPSEEAYADVFPRYGGFFKVFGFKETHLIRSCGVGQTSDPASQEKALELAKEIAEKVTAAG